MRNINKQTEKSYFKQKVIIIFGAMLLLFFIVENIKRSNQGKINCYEKEFSGIVNEIDSNNISRGIPIVLIDSVYMRLCSDSYILFKYLEEGDSIKKISNSNIYIIYKKDSLNNWIPKEFKTAFDIEE